MRLINLCTFKKKIILVMIKNIFNEFLGFDYISRLTWIMFDNEWVFLPLALFCFGKRLE